MSTADVERQEAEVLERLEKLGCVVITEIGPSNWKCEVFDRAGRRQYEVGGGGDGGLFVTRLSAMKWCLRVIENTLDGGYFDVPARGGELPPADSGARIFEWIDDGGYECRDANDPDVRREYEEFLRRRNYPIPPVREEEVLAELRLFGEVRTYEATPDEWMCEVLASNFDQQLHTSARTEGPFRTELDAMTSCWVEINRSDIVRAYRFLEEHRRKALPSPGL